MKRLIPLLLAACSGVALPAQDAPPLRVCATTPNLGALVRAVAGDEPVELTVLAKPSQDPHYVLARPSYVKDVHDADLLVLVGMQLEIGWVPALLDQARNPSVLPGGPGYFDASTLIHPLEVPKRDIDRSEGDLHPLGNPHFLVDPVRGLAVAQGLAEQLSKFRPESKAAFQNNVAKLRAELGALMVGEELAKLYDFTKLAQLFDHGRLVPFLQAQKEGELLKGVFGRAEAHRGESVIVDHNGWIYVTERLGLKTLGYLEPKPGIPPTTKHLGDLIRQVKEAHVHVLLTVPYFDQREIEFVAEHAGVTPVTLAHECGALPGTDDYVSMIRTNLGAILDALDRADSH